MGLAKCTIELRKSYNIVVYIIYEKGNGNLYDGVGGRILLKWILKYKAISFSCNLLYDADSN
jgi:hypothetical protein